MKQNIIFKLSIAAFVSAAFVSCSEFDQMSKNPYALYKEDVPAEEYIHPIMFKTEYSLISTFRNNTIMLMQYGVSISNENSSRIIDDYNIPEGVTDDIWSDLYLQLGNAKAMYDKALKEENAPVQAVALILQSLLITHITDTYGDVPFADAGRLAMSDDLGNYKTGYDTQKDIYCKVVCMLEDANEILKAWEADASQTKYQLPSVCDLTFNGDLVKWRRFGNSLYARVLMRIAQKVIDESNGILDLGDDKWGAIGVQAKLAELYTCFFNKGGEYPQMTGIEDRPLVPFSDQNEVEHTPFYSWTGGNWHTVGVSDVLVRQMLDYTVDTDADGQTVYLYKASSSGGHQEDPRYDCYWRKAFGMPVQLLNKDRARFVNTHTSSEGTSQIGRLPNGAVNSWITKQTYDLKNAPYYPMMQYSELWFIYAEAGARGWVANISDFNDYEPLLENGVKASILEWNPYVTADSPEVTAYLSYIANGKKYSNSKKLTEANAVEAILTEKWLANFFIGIESWCDYRRTGFPLLKTNGPSASNDNILPTRMRYPSDEQYRNPDSFSEVLARAWLGGSNNIQSDVWWASTNESYQNRLKGRQ